MSEPEFPAQFNSEVIIDGYDLVFDPGDKLNGSLYLCTPRGADPTDTHRILQSFRAIGLWSDEPEKAVADEQREAYKNGLEFVAAAAFRTDDGHVVVARFDHSRFPSDEGRWQTWLECIGEAYERLG